MEEKKEEIKIEKQVLPSVIAGIAWPEEGNPAFMCLIREKKQALEQSFDPQTEVIEITNELQGGTLFELFSKLTFQRINVVYASIGNKYSNFINEFSAWKRSNMSELRLLKSQFPSFESGVLKIKELVSQKKIIFPKDSVVRAQLQMFSRLSLKNDTDFYAVTALFNALSGIKKQRVSEVKKDPNIKAWY
jgi:hypothetical protein